MTARKKNWMQYSPPLIPAKRKKSFPISIKNTPGREAVSELSAQKIRSLQAKTPWLIHGPGNTYSLANQKGRWATILPEYKWLPKKWLAVMASADAQCLAKPAGTRADETDVINTSARAHQIDTSPRFKGSDEDCRTWQANRVQAPVNAVRAVHISQSRGTEHTAIPLRLTLEAMGGRIIEQISLDLYDNAAHSVKEHLCAD